ncbi:MAG TPA: glycosyltransferase family 39 protein [Bacteroidales bacterium]|nr:glycosyltransferase family 39 protein [Bacteroidales bacterium]
MKSSVAPKQDISGKEKKQAMNRFLSKSINILFVYLILGFACYAVALKGPMLFDDEQFIQQNKYVHDLNISKIYSSSVTEGAMLNSNFYRPNQQLLFALIYQIWGDNPVPYHLISILLHIINSFLLFLMLRQLGFLQLSAFFGAALYLIHPVHTEAVSYISGAADPLGTCFLLTGIFCFVKGVLINQKQLNSQPKWMILAGVLFLFALFTKENMVVFLPIIVILLIWFVITKKIKSIKPLLKYMLVFTVIAGLYILLKFTVFNFSSFKGLTGEENIYTQKLSVRLITFLSILIEYGKMIFFPLDLNYEKPYTAYTDFFNEKSWFGILLFIVMVFVIVKHKKLPNTFLGMSIFFIGLGPYTGIIPLNAMFLEHWLYIPMIGVTILFATLINYVINKKKTFYLVIPLIVVFIFLGFRTFSRNTEWADIEKFYLNELKYTNSSIRIYNNLGMYYADKNKPNKAISYYKKAVATDDRYPQPHHNIGNIYLSQGAINEAINEFYLALMIDPNFIYSLNKLYEIYKKTGREDKAQNILLLIENANQGKQNDPQSIHNILTSP